MRRTPSPAFHPAAGEASLQAIEQETHTCSQPCAVWSDSWLGGHRDKAGSVQEPATRHPVPVCCSRIGLKVIRNVIARKSWDPLDFWDSTTLEWSGKCAPLEHREECAPWSTVKLRGARFSEGDARGFQRAPRFRVKLAWCYWFRRTCSAAPGALALRQRRRLASLLLLLDIGPGHRGSADGVRRLSVQWHR
jgi:hypothetical protein